MTSSLLAPFPVRLASSALVFLVFGPLVGCRQNDPGETVRVHPVRGLVRWKGQPLAGATIVLHPTAAENYFPRPHSVTQEDGTFVLSTYRSGDGAPEGTYRATIRCRGPYEGKSEDRDEAPEMLPPRYQDPNRSGIVVIVAAADNSLSPWELSE